MSFNNKNKKIKSNIIILFFVLISIFAFCLKTPLRANAQSGNEVSVHLQTYQSSSGMINSMLTIDVSNLDETQKFKILSLMSNYKNQLTTFHKNKFYEIFDKDIDTNQTNLEVLYNSVPINVVQFLVWNFTLTQNSTHIILNINFMSIYAYLLFYYPDLFVLDEETQKVKFDSNNYSTLIDAPIPVIDYKKEDNFFVTKYVQTCAPFYYNSKEYYLLQDYGSYSAGTPFFEVLSSEAGIDYSLLQFQFTFISDYDRLHSSGQKYETNIGLAHTWDLKNDVNGQIVVWRNYANYYAWYLLALIVAILIVGICLSIYFINKKRKKKKTLELLKKIDDFVNNKN